LILPAALEEDDVGVLTKEELMVLRGLLRLNEGGSGYSSEEGGVVLLDKPRFSQSRLV